MTPSVVTTTVPPSRPTRHWSRPAPEDLVEGLKIPAFEEVEHAHQFLYGDGCAGHAHTVRSGTEHPRCSG